MSEAPSRAAARRGRTLKLYLADGTPSGVITAELGVSSVRAAVASRTALPELIRREEAARTGIYLLVGPDPDLAWASVGLCRRGRPGENSPRGA